MQVLVMRAVEVVFASIFVLSSVEHFCTPFRFLDSVLSYQFGNGVLAVLVAVLLPSLQACFACLVIANKSKRFAFLGLGALLSIYSIAQLSALARDLDISCGCFGSLSEGLSWTTVGRTGLLLVVSIWLATQANLMKVSK